MEYAKDAQYSGKNAVKGLSERQEDYKPYRYVRTFRQATRQKLVSEMDEEELQSYVNQILGSQGLDTAIRDSESS